MASPFTKAQMQQARKANLYDYLLSHYPEQYNREHNCIRPKFNHSVMIKRDWAGYLDWGPARTIKAKGNAVDYLTRFHGYTVPEAVAALTGESYVPAVSSPPPPPDEQRHLVIPGKAPNSKRVFAYLTQRRQILDKTVRDLLSAGLVFEDQRGNCVFLNRAKDWGEVRGTGEKKYHTMLTGSRHDGFWFWIPNPDKAAPVYICEAAIDAISLAELNMIFYGKKWGVYVSIGGAGKQAAIDRLDNGKREIVIATDADEAGDAARERNPKMRGLRPHAKDWNEELIYVHTH